MTTPGDTNAPVSPSQLLSEGRFEEVVPMLSRYIDEAVAVGVRPPGGDVVMNYGYRGIALLALHRYREALVNYEDLLRAKAQLRDSANEVDYMGIGIAYWGMRDYEQAISTWRTAATIDPGSLNGVAAIGILLHGARRIGAQEWERYALALLRGFLRLGYAPWPAPLAPFLLGQIGWQEVEQAASVRGLYAVEWQQGQAEFFRGVQQYHLGDMEGFRDTMRRCATNMALIPLFEAFCLARWEVYASFPELGT